MEYKEYIETHDGYKRETPKAVKIIKLILKISLAVVIAAIIAVPVARMIILDTHPEKMEDYYFTDEVFEYYMTKPEELSLYELNVGQNFTDLGYFFTFFTRLTTSADGEISQIQITVRYNDSTVENFNEEYETDYEAGTDIFEFVLADDKGNYYSPSKILEAEKSNLNYRKLIFEDIDMLDVDGLYLNVYPKENFSLNELKERAPEGIDEDAFSGLHFYYSDNVNPVYTFSKRELSHIEELKLISGSIE